jgi:hypothetical protein
MKSQDVLALGRKSTEARPALYQLNAKGLFKLLRAVGHLRLQQVRHGAEPRRRADKPQGIPTG